MTDYRSWLEGRVAFYTDAVHRHCGVGPYQGNLPEWQHRADALRDALAEFDRMRGANVPTGRELS
ncbi:MAG: hypothetical protein JO047_15530 [Alphaproteobacteria bacterium]|nr:hypothetical protein [Alphaproteobacteria bacterium]